MLSSTRVYRPRPTFSQIRFINIKKEKKIAIHNMFMYIYYVYIYTFTTYNCSKSLWMLYGPMRCLFIPSHMSRYSNNYTRKEERISTMPSDCKHQLVGPVMSQKTYLIATDLVCLWKKNMINDISATNVVLEKKLYSIDFFLFLSFFSIVRSTDIFIFRQQSISSTRWYVQHSNTFILSFSLSLKSLISTKVHAIFRFTTHCLKNTAILSQILFGFCRLHDYFTYVSFTIYICI